MSAYRDLEITIATGDLFWITLDFESRVESFNVASGIDLGCI